LPSLPRMRERECERERNVVDVEFLINLLAFPAALVKRVLAIQARR